MILINTVSVLRCDNYDIKNLKSILNKSLENIGGLRKYINKGDKVLLKINLVMAKKPESAATTQPEFLQALTEILIEYGAEVLIGDSPGGPFNELSLKNIYHVCGINNVIKNCSAKLNFNTDTNEVSNPSALILKRLTVVDMLNDVDKVISVARLKTHGMMKMTGATKNMFGIIPGAMKAEYHLNRPDLDMFAKSMIDICIYANPILSFLDGIVAMEGNGPTNGTPRKLNMVVVGDNPFVVDMVASHSITNRPLSIPIIKNAVERGLCPKDINEINIVGENIDSFYVSDFKMPNVVNINPLKSKLPNFAETFINSNLQPKPIFVHNKCIGCRICFDNCPPHAISMLENRPAVELNQCIRCFCCQELCPKDAIDIKRPVLYNIISKI